MLEDKYSTLKEDAERLRQEHQMLLEEIEALEKDPFYIEFYAREKLNMSGKRKEIVLPLNHKRDFVGKKKAHQH